MPSADDSATPLGVGSSTGDLDEETPDNAEDGFAVPKPTAKIAKDEAKIAKDEATKRANQAKVDLKTAETIGNHRVDKRNRDMAKEIEAAKKSKTEVQTTQDSSTGDLDEETPNKSEDGFAVAKPRTGGKELPSADDSDGGKQIRSSERIAKKSKEKASEAPEKVEEKEKSKEVPEKVEEKENKRKAAKKLTDTKFKLAAKIAKDEAKIAKDEAKIAKDEATKRANQAKVDLKTAETIGNLKTAHLQMKTLLKSAKEDYHRVDKRNRDMAKEIEAAKKSKTEVQPTQTQVPEQLSDRNELKELLTDLKVMHGDFKKTQVDMQTEKIVTAVEKNKPVELAEVMKSIVCVQKSMFEGMSSVIKSVVPSRDHHEARPVVAPAVVCIKDLEGKKLSKWTVEDVQRWLDHSNQPGLRPLAGKNYVDGASLILLGDNPCLCSDIWPSLSAFEKIRIQQSIVQCRAAYEHL